jgi:hypothetical protein
MVTSPIPVDNKPVRKPPIKVGITLALEYV